MAKYILNVELEQLAKNKVAVVLYADRGDLRTGLMNTNYLSTYVEEGLIAEDSTTPLVLHEQEAKWLIFSVLKDWEHWENFLNYDMVGSDLG